MCLQSWDQPPLDHLHLFVGVVAALGWGHLIEGGDLLGGEGDRVGGGVLLYAVDAFGAGDRDDVVAFGQQPGLDIWCRSRVLADGH